MSLQTIIPNKNDRSGFKTVYCLKFMRRRLVLISSMIILVLAVFAGAVRYRVWRALPQVEGTHRLAGLKNEVTVQRDSRGVPHIQGDSLEDVFVAQGYAMAQDRLWQMDLVRRAAAGRLSEIAGARTLEIDRSFRQLGLGAAAERDVSLLGKDERLELNAFARGVNQYLQERHPLPIEFAMLWYEPEPWRPQDSLLVIGYMYQSLTNSWQSDLDRVETVRRLGKERAALLYNGASPYDRPVVGEQSSETGLSRILAAPRSSAHESVARPIRPAFEMPDLAWTDIAERSLLEFDSEVRANIRKQQLGCERLAHGVGQTTSGK
jgi:acyl-homoserine lactone acylase PvdQ